MSHVLIVRNMTELTSAQFAALRQLTVTPHQEVLGKSFLESIEDWENAPQGKVLGLCFLINDQPVGLVLFNRHGDTASIHGLKIALPWQNRGLGHQAFQLGVAHLKGEWPETKTLKCSVDTENTPAIVIYRAYGMRDTRPVSQGSNGGEHHMEISLSG